MAHKTGREALPGRVFFEDLRQCEGRVVSAPEGEIPGTLLHFRAGMKRNKDRQNCRCPTLALVGKGGKEESEGEEKGRGRGGGERKARVRGAREDRKMVDMSELFLAAASPKKRNINHGADFAWAGHLPHEGRAAGHGQRF